MLESRYQAGLIRKIKTMFPDCVVIKLPSDYVQGLPDLLILFGNQWACLEVKAHANSPLQPNQEYYIRLLDGMSFASFIYPEVEEDILHELYLAFSTRGKTRFSKRE